MNKKTIINTINLPHKKGPFYPLVGNQAKITSNSKISIKNKNIEDSTLVIDENNNLFNPILIEIEFTIRQLTKLYCNTENNNENKKQISTWIKEAESRAKDIINIINKKQA